MNKFELKDSGQRQEFGTGAVRDIDDNKPKFSLLPVHALSRVAMHFTRGREKYPPDKKEGERIPIENWRRGIDTSRSMDSLLRHAFAYLSGARDEDHLAAVIVNALFIMETEHMVELGILSPELLTLPDWTQKDGNIKKQSHL
jgi:hypothetical protein